MTKSERVAAADAFLKFARRAKKGSGPLRFSTNEEDEDAIQFAADIIRRLREGWLKSGRTRDKQPTTSALYFRVVRARNAVKAAVNLGVTGGGKSINELQDELVTATADWEAAKKRDAEKQNQRGTP